MIANLFQRVRNAVSGTVAATALAAALFCGCETRHNPYQDMNLEQVVSSVKSPKEAQDFIDMNLEYAYEDLGVQRYTALNGAEVQSFRKTFDRKKGVCRDGAVAVAAMLQDDGFSARVLDVMWTGGKYDGHSVFVYQDGEGRWGSAGINASDFRHTDFSRLEDLARDVAHQFNGVYKGFYLHDLSLVDLIEGTNEGLVAKTPFVKERVTDSERIYYTILKIPTGFGHNWATATPEQTSIECDKYTEDLYLDERKVSGEQMGVKYEEQWNVLMRAPCRLPIETLRTTTTDGEVITDRNWFVYAYDNQNQQEVWEARRNGALVAYVLTMTEYLNSKKSAVERRQSNDGDYQFDKIDRFELNPDGTMTVYMDNNADGVWDSITTSSQ